VPLIAVNDIETQHQRLVEETTAFLTAGP